MENDLDGIGLYVRYHKYRPGPIEVKRATGRYIWMDCPDREIVVQRERYYAYDPTATLAHHPENYDEYVHLDVNNAMVMDDIQLDFCMLNATSVQGSGHRKNEGDRDHKHTKLVIDSGGFQLYAGTEDWITPEDVIQTQNLHGDLGMVLDLPCPISVDPKLMAKIAWIQRKNTDVMIERKRKGLELINIVHGIEPAAYHDFHSRIERDELDRLAFGAARRADNPLRGVRKVTDLITTLGKRYKHYHVLGISDIVKTVPVMWLAKMGAAELITVDSSTHVRNAANGMYLLYHTVRSSLEKLDVSRKNTRPNRQTTLPCQCAVCSRLKYSDALAFIPGALMTRVLTFHNLIEFRKYLYTVKQIAYEVETIEEFLKEIRWSITKERHEEARVGLKIAEVGMQDGMKAVDKQFHFQLHQTGGSASGLFQGDVSINEREDIRYKRLLKKVQEYRDYHVKNRVPKV